MPDWTIAIQEAYASAPADEYVISTLELIHPAFVDAEDNADTVRVALDGRDWDLLIEDGAPIFAGEIKTFSALALEVSLPEQSEESFGALNIALDNVPRDIWTKLQAAARVRASALLIYREWVATRDLVTKVYSAPGPPDMIIDQLTMRVVTATTLRMEGQATFVDLLNKQFPRRKFTREGFPGLFGVS